MADGPFTADAQFSSLPLSQIMRVDTLASRKEWANMPISAASKYTTVSLRPNSTY